MTDRRELIRNGASWAVALSLAVALSTKGERGTVDDGERGPANASTGAAAPRSGVAKGLGSGSAIWLWSATPLLVGPTRPPLPLVVGATSPLSAVEAIVQLLHQPIWEFGDAKSISIGIGIVVTHMALTTQRLRRGPALAFGLRGLMRRAGPHDADVANPPGERSDGAVAVRSGSGGPAQARDRGGTDAVARCRGQEPGGSGNGHDGGASL